MLALALACDIIVKNIESSSKDSAAPRRAACPTMQSVDRLENASQGSPASQGHPVLDQLTSALESLLFVAGRPLERAELRRLLAVDDIQMDATLAALAAQCERRGVRVQRLG